MYYFCTYFDRNYLPRGLALYSSLRKNCSEFRLWVLCMDDATYAALTQLALPEIELIALQDFEEGDAALLAAKQNRSKIEYYFTCTPSLPLFVLNHWSEVNLITYLDADLYFFASPAPLFEELGLGSIAIIGHRLSAYMRKDEVYGIFNVGWLSFRRDDNGSACLNWWRAKCIEWCYDRLEDDRFADQKYLDDWPSRFSKVVVLEHKGANVATWNVADSKLQINKKQEIQVDESPLIFFHFHGLKRIVARLYDPGWAAHGVKPSHILRKHIYHPYLRCLSDAMTQLSIVAPYSSGPVIRRSADQPAEGRVFFLRSMFRKLFPKYIVIKNCVNGRYLVCTKVAHLRNDAANRCV